jgi:hypothetical protein
MRLGFPAGSWPLFTALLSDVATATLNAIELLPVELALVSTKFFSIEPCLADRAAVAQGQPYH